MLVVLWCKVMENHWRFSQLPDIVEPETEHNLMCTGVVLVEVGKGDVVRVSEIDP